MMRTNMAAPSPISKDKAAMWSILALALMIQFGLGQAHFQHAGESQNRPLLHAAFERSRFVNIDHDRFLFGAVPTTHRHRLLCMG